jgi:4-amino-4-deoxy-L-arabinose transferase-like glycosyltransferase
VSDWAARVPVALDATLLVFGVYFAVRRLWGSLALDAALAAASGGALIVFGRAASTDMPLAAMFGLAMLCWLVWWTETRRAGAAETAALSAGGRRLLLAGFYVFAGAATLAKGPVAPFLAALVLAVFALWRCDVQVIRRTWWWPGIGMYLVVTLPWYVLVQRSTGTFFRVFILEHNLSRYGTNVFRHPQPVWFFVPVLLGSLLPWTVPAIAGWIESVRGTWRRSDDGGATAAAEADARRLLVLWGALPVLFFSFSGSKLPGYILPALAPFAILAALYLRGDGGGRARPPLGTVLVHAVVAAATTAAALLGPHLLLRLRPPVAAVAIAATIAAAIFLLTVWLYVRWGAAALRLVTLLPMIVALAFLLRAAAPVIDGKLSARPLALELEEIAPANAPVALYYAPREVEYGLNFYRNQRIRRLELEPAPAQGFLLLTSTDDRQTLLNLAAREGRPRTVRRLLRLPGEPLYVCWVDEPAAPR